MATFTRRHTLVASIAAWFSALLPRPASAGASISIKVGSVGPFEAGIDIPIRVFKKGIIRGVAKRLLGPIGLTIDAVQVAKWAYDKLTHKNTDEEGESTDEEWSEEESDDASSHTYYASYSGSYSAPVPKPLIVTVKPDDTLKGEVIRIRHYEIVDIETDTISLPNQGSLKIEEDGKLRFQNTVFEGYVQLQYDGKLTVWHSTDRLVLVLTRQDRDILVLREDSNDSINALKALIGVKNDS